MTHLGHFLFHWRNGLFPLAYLLLFVKSAVPPYYPQAAWLGLVIAGAGQALRIATIGLDYIVRGGRNRRVYADDLVVGGLFSHCRNPLYVGNYLILVGLGIASCSFWYLAVALPFLTLAYWAITLAEEEFLRGKFGPAYDEYCAKVSRYLLRWSGLWRTLTGATFNWRVVVVKEYGSAFIWSAAFVIVVQQNRVLAGESSWTSGTASLLLWTVFAFLCLAYAVARYLKKYRNFGQGR